MLLLLLGGCAFLQDPGTVDAWIRRLDDDDPQVRLAAATALSERWGDDGVRKRIADLRDRAKREGNLDLHAAAGRILEKFAAFDEFASAVGTGDKQLSAKADAVPYSADTLHRISEDEARAPKVRAAALALLGARAPEERVRELREILKTIHERVRPMHVVRFEMYVNAVETRLKAGELKLTADDIPLLARMGLLENDGLALICLSQLVDSRSFDVLLAAGSSHLGEEGDAVLMGLGKFAAADRRYRDALAAQIEGTKDRTLGWMRALMALFASGDGRAVGAVAGLLQDLGEGRLQEAPFVGSSRLLSLIGRHPHADYAAPLRAWIRRGGIPLSDLAGALKACSGALDKEELWALLERHTQSWEVTTVVNLLQPRLDETDRGRLLEMIAPAHWDAESFYVRFDLLDRCDAKLFTPQVAAALWKVVDECDHAYYRARALKCVDRAGDPADERRFARLVGDSGDLGLEALRALLKRSDRSLELFLETLGSGDAGRQRTALRLMEVHFLSRGEWPIPPTDENWTRMASKLLGLIDSSKDEGQLRDLLRALYTTLAGTPRAKFSNEERREAAERLRRASDRFATDPVRHLVKICMERLE